MILPANMPGNCVTKMSAKHICYHQMCLGLCVFFKHLNSVSAGAPPGPRCGSLRRSYRPPSELARETLPPHYFPLDVFGVSISAPAAPRLLAPLHPIYYIPPTPLMHYYDYLRQGSCWSVCLSTGGLGPPPNLFFAPNAAGYVPIRLQPVRF